MSENMNNYMEEIPERTEPYYFISINTSGKYGAHPIFSYQDNTLREGLARIPDDMVEAIQETWGLCDLVLNDDETEVVNFTPREKPEIPEPTPEPTLSERVTTVEEQLLATDEVAVELYEAQLAQEEINIAQDEALCELYEMVGV